MKIMRRINKNGRFILTGMLVPFLMTLHMIRSLTKTERILCTWEGRDMLESNIKIGSLFYFKMTILMKSRRTIYMPIFYREG